MSMELKGVHSRAAAAAYEPARWVLQDELSDNPYIADRVRAAHYKERCAVFINTRPDAVTPSYRAYTQAALRDKDTCLLLDLVGINKSLRDQALEKFPSNVVPLDPHMNHAVSEEPRHQQRQQQQQHQHQP